MPSTKIRFEHRDGKALAGRIDLPDHLLSDRRDADYVEGMLSAWADRVLDE
jgi:hypothetical protein